jgi:hypothetical protein
MKSSEKSQFNDPNDWQNFTKYIYETNRFVLTDDWEYFMGLIIKTSHKRTEILKKGTKLLRARTGTNWVQFDDGDEQPCPISPLEMGPPPKDLSGEGRLNSKGIPYLYLAMEIETAIAEVKPWIGTELSIGSFEILEDLRIVDTTKDKPNNILSKYQFTSDGNIKKRPIETYTSKEKEKHVWGDINSAFSMPISPSDTLLKYLPTQFLAEKLKTNNYDGVAYRSSLNQDGVNVTIFDPEKAKCIGCRMFKVKQLKYKYEECGNPVGLSRKNKVLHQRIKFIEPVDIKNPDKKTN